MTGTTTVLAFSTGTNDVILGIAAAILVGTALVVSIVLPRRSPDFPGRYLRRFVLLMIVLVAGMLVAVEALGESREFESAGGGAGTAQTTPADTTEQGTAPTSTATQTDTGETSTGQTQTGEAPASGDPSAGKGIFAANGCGSCHTLQEAGTSGTIGPDLDEGLKGKDPAYIRESIADPNAEITEGFPPDVMPQDYGQKLSDTQLADLVAFLDQSANG